ncbi:TPR-like protein [Aspergillus ellipticus CBS 707.79]|uniref:TPR-like protein n=1 Tax=Aspergillus ellipticus CBS 707.79 TaxID=1448320 RepID=A0A319D4Z5_9EURO|nr:TPR-like protein [Aspergillus ellipticus CBS 707.79]
MPAYALLELVDYMCPRAGGGARVPKRSPDIGAMASHRRERANEMGNFAELNGTNGGFQVGMNTGSISIAPVSTNTRVLAQSDPRLHRLLSLPSHFLAIQISSIVGLYSIRYTADAREAVPGRPLLTYLLPVTPSGSIIITSRSKDCMTGIVEENDRIIISPMDIAQATRLFEKKVGVMAKKEDLIELSNTLDCLPLAMAQAAAYINQREGRLSVSEYLKRFRKSDKKSTALLDFNGGQLRRDLDANNCILRTWQISFEHIQSIRPVAADLQSLMCFFDRQGIPGTLLRYQQWKENTYKESTTEEEDSTYDDADDNTSESNTDDEFEEDLIILRNYLMISSSADGTSFEMHRLVQLAMRKWLEACGMFEKWKQRFIKILCREFPEGNFENWALCEPLFSHVQSAAMQRPEGEQSLQEWAGLLYQAAWYAASKENGAESEKMAILSMRTRQRLFGPNTLEAIDSVEIVGMAYDIRGKWKEAEDLHLQVLETRRQVLGPQHLVTLQSMETPGLNYCAQGRWHEAENIQTQAVKTCKRILGSEHHTTLASINSLASTYTNQGKWTEAENLQLQLVETIKNIRGLKHPDTLTIMDDLASIYWKQERQKEAEGLQIQVIELRKQVLGLEYPDVLQSISNLSAIYSSQLRLDKAEELQIQVIELRKQVLGPEHPNTLISMNNLASTYSKQGREMEAEELNARVFELCKQVLGPEHPSTLVSMSNLASTYLNQGREKEAEELQIQVVEISKQVFEPEYSDTPININDLSAIHWAQGRVKEAQEIQTQVLEARKRVVGSEHPATLMSMHNLALVLRASGDLKAAFQLMKECVQLRGRILGPDHPDTIYAASTLSEWDGTDDSQSTESSDAMTETQISDHPHAAPTEPPELVSTSKLTQSSTATTESQIADHSQSTKSNDAMAEAQMSDHPRTTLTEPSQLVSTAMLTQCRDATPESQIADHPHATRREPLKRASTTSRPQ